jgi:hypothetical protein
MTATAIPTMTHGLTAAQRKALVKAIKLNGAALVTRLEYGVYAVPSQTQPGVEYLVRGVRLDGSDHSCTCEAGNRGIPCWHIAAVRLARVQAEAKRQARKLAQATPAPIDPWTPAKRAAQRAHGAAAYLRSKQWGADMTTSNAE